MLLIYCNLVLVDQVNVRQTVETITFLISNKLCAVAGSAAACSVETTVSRTFQKTSGEQSLYYTDKKSFCTSCLYASVVHVDTSSRVS